MLLTEYCNKLRDFYRSHRRMPSYRELMSIWDYKSTSAVQYTINKLIEARKVSRDRAGKLIFTTLGDTKMLGLVEAGFPSPAEEDRASNVSLDDYLIQNKEATYILKVKGDSMMDAGILDGDMVLVERGKTPRPGDIVVAEIDGGYTMKYYRLKGREPYLEAANPAFPNMYPKHNLKIDAIVQAVIRKY